MRRRELITRKGVHAKASQCPGQRFPRRVGRSLSRGDKATCWCGKTGTRQVSSVVSSPKTSSVLGLCECVRVCADHRGSLEGPPPSASSSPPSLSLPSHQDTPKDHPFITSPASAVGPVVSWLAREGGGGEAAGIRGRGRRGPGGAGLGWPRRARARPLETRPARIPKPPRLDRCLECSKVSATFHAAEHVVTPHSAETSSALSTEELYPLSPQRHSKASSSSVTLTPAGWPRPQKAFAGSAGVAARVFLFPTD